MKQPGGIPSLSPTVGHDEDKMGRPFGHLFRPTYRDRATGKRRLASFWWLKYTEHGSRRYLNTHCKKKADAEKIRRQVAARVWACFPVQERPRVVTVGELLDYDATRQRLKGRLSLYRTGHVGARIGAFFGRDQPAAGITEARITEYVASLKGRGLGNATVNNDLAQLRRALRLATRTKDERGRPWLERVPVIEMLEPPPPRAGFMEEWELRKVMGFMPPPARNLLLFLYVTGYRPSEARALLRAQIDWTLRLVQLPPGTTKNKSGRDPFPFAAHPWLERLLTEQEARAQAIEAQRGIVVRHVFQWDDGRAIKDISASWTMARARAGMQGRITYELRKSAVRNLILAGVDRKRAMRLTGHKTESVFERYNIVAPGDLEESVTKLARFHEQQHRAGQMVIPFRRA